MATIAAATIRTAGDTMPSDCRRRPKTGRLAGVDETEERGCIMTTTYQHPCERVEQRFKEPFTLQGEPKKPLDFPVEIIVDDREKRPYRFENIVRGNQKICFRTERKRLQTGDYTLKHYENKIAVERKSLSDLYSTLGASAVSVAAANIADGRVGGGQKYAVASHCRLGFRRWPKRGHRKTIGGWCVAIFAEYRRAAPD